MRRIMHGPNFVGLKLSKFTIKPAFAQKFRKLVHIFDHKSLNDVDAHQWTTRNLHLRFAASWKLYSEYKNRGRDSKYGVVGDTLFTGHVTQPNPP